MKRHLPLAAALAATLSLLGHAAFAGSLDDQDIEPRFRAKIVKEKLKMRAREGSFDFTRVSGDSDADCGSQNIGNVDTGGKIGRTPREVFVFAPNAINLVSGRGCR